jgi:hypothetical protein
MLFQFRSIHDYCYRKWLDFEQSIYLAYRVDEGSPSVAIDGLRTSAQRTRLPHLFRFFQYGDKSFNRFISFWCLVPF